MSGQIRLAIDIRVAGAQVAVAALPAGMDSVPGIRNVEPSGDPKEALVCQRFGRQWHGPMRVYLVGTAPDVI